MSPAFVIRLLTIAFAVGMSAAIYPRVVEKTSHRRPTRARWMVYFLAATVVVVFLLVSHGVIIAAVLLVLLLFALALSVASAARELRPQWQAQRTRAGARRALTRGERLFTRTSAVDAASPMEGEGRAHGGWLEVLGWGSLYVGYDLVMVVAYHMTMGIPRRTEPWLEAFTAAAVIRDYAPKVIGTAFVIGAIAILHRWRDAAITTEPKASLWGIVPLLAYVAVVVAFAPLASQPRASTVFSVVWIGVLVAAFNEEAVMRGILLAGMARRWSPARAAWLTTILFGAAHLSGLWTGHALADLYQGVWSATLHGAVYTKVRLATGSLWFAVVLHGIGNFTTYLTAYGPSLGTSAFRVVNRVSLLVGGALLLQFIVTDVVSTWRGRRRVTTPTADPDTVVEWPRPRSGGQSTMHSWLWMRSGQRLPRRR